MKLWFTYFLLATLFISCMKEEKIEFSKFPREIKLVHKEITTPNVLFMVGEMELLDSALIILNLKDDKFFQIFTFPDLKYLGGYLEKGRGPNEEVSIDPYIRHLSGNKLMFKTLVSVKIAQLNMRELIIIKTIHIPGELLNLNHPFIIDTILYGYNVSKITNKEFSGYVQGTNNIIDFGPSYPKVGKKIPPKFRNNIFAKAITVKPDQSRFASVYDLFPLLRIYSKNGNLLKQTYYNNGQKFPSAIMSHPTQEEANKVMQNYRKIKASKQYIYALYNGKTIGESKIEFNDDGIGGLTDTSNEIHVWDWDGNPIMKILLDRQIFSFCITPDDKSIICTSINSLNILLKYDIDN